MKTKIAYFDESGDDGIKKNSSEIFVLTSLYMPSEKWQHNFELFKVYRQLLKEKYGFHISEEMHIKNFLTDKLPYRNYGWESGTRIMILKTFIKAIAELDAKVINVIIDKNNIDVDDYDVLKKAFTYNIQRIENDSDGDWNYILISDEGRIAPMRKTAREIRVFNPIQSVFSGGSYNKPIRYMIEDIFSKDSKESYFIQACDFIAYFVNLFYKVNVLGGELPHRVANLIDNEFILSTLQYFKEKEVFNLNASTSNEYGFVIYPKK